MSYLKENFNSVGWFIPPYVGLGLLTKLSKQIDNKTINEENLENFLREIFSSEFLAAMVSNRYSDIPHIQDYKEIISESIKAHFLKLDHIAIIGLMPVIEGVARKISNLPANAYIRDVFLDLAETHKDFVITNNIGAVHEIVETLESFKEFARENLYINSTKYPFKDNTNRHGILHGAYSDNEYGTPLNFYKAISAINVLCFIVSIKEPISFFGPPVTSNSRKLSYYYNVCHDLNNLI